MKMNTGNDKNIKKIPLGFYLLTPQNALETVSINVAL